MEKVCVPIFRFLHKRRGGPMHASKVVTFAAIVGAVIAVALFPGFAEAQQKFPTKPIRLVVAFSAGGVPDTLSRLIGPRMSDTWGQPVVIENRSGGAGVLAAADRKSVV